jgi:hypothetical protein
MSAQRKRSYRHFVESGFFTSDQLKNCSAKKTVPDGQLSIPRRKENHAVEPKRFESARRILHKATSESAWLDNCSLGKLLCGLPSNLAI